MLNSSFVDKLNKDPTTTLIDIQFGKFIYNLSKAENLDLFLTAVLVSNRMNQGHVCLDLTQFAGQSKALFFENLEGVFPEYHPWLELLQSNSVIGKPGDFAPLILEAPFLYLYRYWLYERELARLLKLRILSNEEIVAPEKLKETLTRHFPQKEGALDWQKIATLGAYLKRFCIISGSPGTGKTSTVVRLLAVLLELSSSLALHLQIAAPTGKAAARLQESILENKQKLNCSDTIKNRIPEEVSTIHRLLGYVPDSHYFRHHVGNPLMADVLVIDEASMVDLALMTQLISALRPSARLILIGDQNQLTSVEAGWVFGSLCAAKQQNHYSQAFLNKLEPLSETKIPLKGEASEREGLQDCIMQLYKSFRFHEDSGIMALSQAIIEGDIAKAIRLLQDKKLPDIKWTNVQHSDPFYSLLKSRILEGYQAFLALPDSEVLAVFQAFSQFRILCSIHKTETGVEAMNLLVEFILKEKNLIDPESKWYRGRPVMITRNDYHLQLFNGDIGITLKDPEYPDRLKVYFPESEGKFRAFLPQRLPQHETAYATTVHKSQGSEFKEVLFILPHHRATVLTRELIYTAVTRGKESVEIVGEEDVLRYTIQAKEERVSGLQGRLMF